LNLLFKQIVNQATESVSQCLPANQAVTPNLSINLWYNTETAKISIHLCIRLRIPCFPGHVESHN